MKKELNVSCDKELNVSCDKELNASCDLAFKPILSIDEACLFLNYGKSYLQELRETGKIAYLQKKGGKKAVIRFKREHLLDYIEKNFDEMTPFPTQMKYQLKKNKS
ncbi:hypothetical protein AGMMS49525_10370 [Bacteroidia bacterium]|nr:hypothetical protein AGMMS49525_10370 [Bacteroidia bacterium]